MRFPRTSRTMGREATGRSEAAFPSGTPAPPSLRGSTTEKITLKRRRKKKTPVGRFGVAVHYKATNRFEAEN